MRACLLFAVTTLASSLVAQQPSTQPAVTPTSLTISSDDFAVASTQIDLDLHPGINEVTTSQITARIEPDSVILRDANLHESAKKPALHIVEQYYDPGVVSQDVLFRKYDGKSIDFQPSGYWTGEHYTIPPIVSAKVIHASIQPGLYLQGQWLFEVDGKLVLQMPGAPIFPASAEGLSLKPTLHWQIESEKAQKLSAELSYITGGICWDAAYNLISPDANNDATEDKASLTGWVTIHNQTGMEFPQANVKLMAGDIARNKTQGNNQQNGGCAAAPAANANGQAAQKGFDGFHLYDLHHTVILHDGETKEIQFIDAPGITLARSYRYEGSSENRLSTNNYSGNINSQQNYGLSPENTRVQVFEEFTNTAVNQLGVPLPAGRVRIYRRDTGGHLEYTGESAINHISAEDMIKFATVNSRDIKGSRRQADFVADQSHKVLTESFEIKLTNQKPQPVTVNVLEHLYRGDNWEITVKSGEYTKLDSHTIQFPVAVPAKGEATLTYTVHYSW